MQPIAAYISWTAWLRSLDSLGPEPPRTLHPSSFNLQPSTASQMLQAYPFFGLLGSDGKVTDDLRLLIEHPHSRRALLGKVLARAYPQLIAEGKAVRADDLDRYSGALRAGAVTQRKAAVFFQSAAAYAGLNIERAATNTDSASQPAVAAHSIEVRRRSHGAIQMSVEFDPFRISTGDRQFLFELIDRLRTYEDELFEQKCREESENPEEVPF